MKIEFLYFDGCPNHELALNSLKKILAEIGVKDKIELIQVESPEAALEHRFLGSPSIRINDHDLEISEDKTTDYLMNCRRYRYGDMIAGYPAPELIREKLLVSQ